MKNTKKTLSITLAIAMLILSITSCGQSDGSNAEGIDENGFWAGIRALDYVELADYQGIEIPLEVHQDAEGIYSEIIYDIINEFIMYDPIYDGIVVFGDTVNIDYVGSIDGIEFAGGSTEGMGTNVTIGLTSYIDDFLEQLIGHSPGDTIDVQVTFPYDYPQNTDLEGREAVFITTINYIGINPTYPDLTDEFVMGNLSMYGWSSVDDMNYEIWDYILSNQRNSIQQYLYNYLYDNFIVTSIPESIINNRINEMADYYETMASDEGIGIDELLLEFGFENMDEMLDANRADLEREAAFSLIVQAIAEDAGISVSDDEVRDFFTEYYGEYLTYEEEHGMPVLKQFVLNERVFEYILDRVILL